MFLKNIFHGFMRFASSFGLLCVATAMLMGVMARHFWWAELATHFVIHIWAASLLLMILFLLQSRWKGLAASLLIFLWHSYLLFPLFVPQERLLSGGIDAQSPAAMRILQYNLHYTDTDVAERIEWVKQEAPKMDVVVLLEVSDHHAPLIAALQKQFPYHFIRPMREYRGVAVFSRLASSQFVLRDTSEKSTHFVIMSAIDKVSGLPLAMFVIHPPPPVSRDTAVQRNDYFAQLANEIIANPSPRKIAVGDFNVTRWSPYLKKLMKLTGMADSFEGFGHNTTWPSWLPGPLRLTIDNLLVYQDPASASRMLTLDKAVGPANGSDHYPVITTLY